MAIIPVLAGLLARWRYAPVTLIASPPTLSEAEARINMEHPLLKRDGGAVLLGDRPLPHCNRAPLAALLRPAGIATPVQV